MVFRGVSTYIHGVPLTDRHHHDPRGCPYVCGALKLSVRNHGPNDIGIHNKFRENVPFRVTIESPREHVYTVLWCDEDSRVLVVMAADVCYNGVKVYGVPLDNSVSCADTYAENATPSWVKCTDVMFPKI